MSLKKKIRQAVAVVILDFSIVLAKPNDQDGLNVLPACLNFGQVTSCL